MHEGQKKVYSTDSFEKGLVIGASISFLSDVDTQVSSRASSSSILEPVPATLFV